MVALSVGAERKGECVAPFAVQVMVPLEVCSILVRGQHAEIDSACVVSSGGYAVGGNDAMTVTKL